MTTGFRKSKLKRGPTAPKTDITGAAQRAQQQLKGFKPGTTQPQISPSLTRGMTSPGDYSSILAEARDVAGQAMGDIGAAKSSAEALAQQYTSREAALSPLAEGLGGAERAMLDRRREQALASATQQAISSGRGKTTALDAARRGIEEAAGMEASGLEGRLTAEKMGYLGGLSGETLQGQFGLAGYGTQAAQLGFQAQGLPINVQQQLAQLRAQEQISGIQTSLGYQQAQQGVNLNYLQMNAAQKLADQQRAAQLGQLGSTTSLGYAQLLQQQQLADLARKTASATSPSAQLAAQGKRITTNYF
jgi:hypothetical protein